MDDISADSSTTLDGGASAQHSGDPDSGSGSGWGLDGELSWILLSLEPVKARVMDPLAGNWPPAGHGVAIFSNCQC